MNHLEKGRIYKQGSKERIMLERLHPLPPMSCINPQKHVNYWLYLNVWLGEIPSFTVCCFLTILLCVKFFILFKLYFYDILNCVTIWKWPTWVPGLGLPQTNCLQKYSMRQKCQCWTVWNVPMAGAPSVRHDLMVRQVQGCFFWTC